MFIFAGLLRPVVLAMMGWLDSGFFSRAMHSFRMTRKGWIATLALLACNDKRKDLLRDDKWLAVYDFVIDFGIRFCFFKVAFK
ncbi:hypothetical protein [uncultured Helicobacter sp.]|uniref:hypothetical protein n=1 Tax=uncultured Helicobacter sp. TaxID=175537 RepID=UPI002587FCBD|nr:hypothetical protein [uncultured Helicobacter sp.]